MKEKKKNEEFHSRREFFKKALKGILCLLVTILTMTNRMVVAVLPVAVLQVALLV